MAQVTYTAKAGDPVKVQCHGFTFEHGKPAEVPDDHPFVKQTDGNPWFSVDGKKKREAKPASEPETPEAYFTYAVDWLGKARTSGEIESRWNNEEPLRTKVGWGADDEDKMRPILQPKLDTMKSAEKSLRN